MSYGFSPTAIGLLEFYSLHDRRASCVCLLVSRFLLWSPVAVQLFPRLHLGHRSVMDVVVQNGRTARLTDFSPFAVDLWYWDAWVTHYHEF